MAISIYKVWGIGGRTAEILQEYGYKTAEDIANAPEDGLSKVHGFGVARAKKVIAAAQSLVESEKPSLPATAKKKKENKKKEKAPKKTKEKKSKKKKEKLKEKKKKSKKKQVKKKAASKKKK